MGGTAGFPRHFARKNPQGSRHSRTTFSPVYHQGRVGDLCSDRI